MDQRGITPAKLAPRIAISERTIYRIINGQRYPTIQELARFAVVLDLSIPDLISVEWNGRDLFKSTNKKKNSQEDYKNKKMRICYNEKIRK